MQQYVFREADKPRFTFDRAMFIALLLLVLLFFVGKEAVPYGLSPEEIELLKLEQEQQQRDLVFRFLDQPEDPIEENPDARFFSDANREAKSEQVEDAPSENEDPISRGDTYELENRQAAVPAPVQPQMVQQNQPMEQPSEAERDLGEAAKETSPEKTEPFEEPIERDEPEPVEDDNLGNVPLPSNAPKPFRRLTDEELALAKKKAVQELMALESTVGQSRQNQARQFDNAEGRVAENLGFSVDTAGHNLGPYLKILVQLVRGNWRIPAIARFEVSGVAVVSFKLHQDGRFTDATIDLGSGHEPLDVSSLNAIVSTGKAPPLPEHIKEEWIPIRFAFYYNMRPR